MYSVNKENKMSNKDKAISMLKEILDYRVPSYNWRWQGRVARLSDILDEHPDIKLKVYSNCGRCATFHRKSNMFYVGATKYGRWSGYQIWASQL